MSEAERDDIATMSHDALVTEVIKLRLVLLLLEAAGLVEPRKLVEAMALATGLK